MFTNRDDFRVKKTIGSSWNVDEDDVVKTKTALKKTGDYKQPDWGVTGYPDQDMFDGPQILRGLQGILRAAPPHVGAAEEARKQVERSGGTGGEFPSPIPQPPKVDDRAKDQSNRVVIDPPPSTPGFEPPDEKLPDRTESPAEPVEVEDLAGSPETVWRKICRPHTSPKTVVFEQPRQRPI